MEFYPLFNGACFLVEDFLAKALFYCWNFLIAHLWKSTVIKINTFIVSIFTLSIFIIDRFRSIPYSSFGTHYRISMIEFLVSSLDDTDCKIMVVPTDGSTGRHSCSSYPLKRKNLKNLLLLHGFFYSNSWCPYFQYLKNANWATENIFGNFLNCCGLIDNFMEIMSWSDEIVKHHCQWHDIAMT